MIFSRKMFLMLYFINEPNFIAWFPLLLEILSNICIYILGYKFWKQPIFLIKPLFYMTKKSKQKLKYLKNENRWNENNFSSLLKGLPIAKSFLKPESTPLKPIHIFKKKTVFSPNISLCPTVSFRLAFDYNIALLQKTLHQRHLIGF